MDFERLGQVSRTFVFVHTHFPSEWFFYPRYRVREFDMLILTNIGNVQFTISLRDEVKEERGQSKMLGHVTSDCKVDVRCEILTSVVTLADTIWFLL